MNNQFWFGPSFTWATVGDTIKNMDEYERGVSDAYDAQKNVELQDQTKALLDCQYKTTDGKTKSMNMGGANLGKMEIVIKQAAEANWSSAYKWLWSGQILCRYIQKNPKYMQITNAALAWDISIETWARQIGAMKGTIKQTEQTGEEREYVPTGKKKWKSFAGTLGKWVGAELWVRELIWRPMEGIWNYLENKTINKSTPEDVSREARSAKYNWLQDKYRAILDDYNSELKTLEARLYEATPEEAPQIQSRINELNAKKTSVEERLAELWEREKALPSEQPKTVRETIKDANLKWTDASAAGQLDQSAEILYNTEIKPILKLSQWQWDVWEILKSISKSDFGWMTEWEWKEMQKIINREAAAYSKKYWKVWLEELHKILDDFDLSKASLKWEDPQWLIAQFKDLAHTKIRNIINEAWEEVSPGFGEKMMEYSTKKTGVKQLKNNANMEAGRSLHTWPKQDLKDWLWQAKYKRNWGNRLKRRGKAIRPTTNIMKIVEKIKNPGVTEKLVEKWQEIVSQPKLIESPTLTKISEQLQKSEEQIEKVKNTINSTTKKSTKAKWSKKIVNPREAIQSSLPGFGSPMDFVTVALGDIFEMGWAEMPLDVLTEIASYALESAKLWQPLYDKENSYVNQNPYKDISPLNRWEQASKYYEINWEDIPGYWTEAREAYEAEQWLQQQDWWKELLEEEAKNEKDYKERMDEEDIDIEALIDALN